MPENCWAVVFFLTFVIQISIISAENFHSVEARWFSAYNALLWGFVVLSMLKSVYPPPAAISAEITMAMASFWIWFKPHLECRLILRSWRHVYGKV